MSTLFYSGAVFGGTIYYANQFKKNLQRSATLHNRMQSQQSVTVQSVDGSRIKTHQSVKTKESIDALNDMYEVLPPEVSYINPSMKEQRFIFHIYQNTHYQLFNHLFYHLFFIII